MKLIASFAFQVLQFGLMKSGSTRMEAAAIAAISPGLL